MWCCFWNTLSWIWFAASIYFIVQFVRLVFADADLTLLWAEKFGKSVESLSGKVVWITGASSGIGENLACQLAKVQCKLILSSRRKEELERVKKQCLVSGKISEEDIYVLPLDQLDLSTHKDVTSEAWKKFGQIDILINNAGRTQRALVEETEVSVDQRLMDLNFIGVVSLTKQVLPYMLERNKGHIVVTSSAAGKLGAPNSASYTASKHAIQGWFDAFRIELGSRPISITLVCPGPVYSNLIEFAITGERDGVHGIPNSKKEKRMSTERCAELMIVAIANNLDEVWMSTQPILLSMYLSQYMPTLFKWVAKKLGMKALKAIREGQR